jgi:hypothetical protein
MSQHLVLLKVSLEVLIVRSWTWLVMLLSLSSIYAAVAKVTRCTIVEALFRNRKRDRRKDGEMLDSSNIQAHTLLKY